MAGQDSRVVESSEWGYFLLTAISVEHLDSWSPSSTLATIL